MIVVKKKICPKILNNSTHGNCRIISYLSDPATFALQRLPLPLLR